MGNSKYNIGTRKNIFFYYFFPIITNNPLLDFKDKNSSYNSDRHAKLVFFTLESLKRDDSFGLKASVIVSSLQTHGDMERGEELHSMIMLHLGL